MTTPASILNVSDQIDEAEPNHCFIDSRRLTGANRYFSTTAVILTPLGDKARNNTALMAWQQHAESIIESLGWALSSTFIHRHATGTYLLISAPSDQLFTATEVNEWAWEAVNPDLFGPNGTFEKLHHFTDAATYFSGRAQAERRPDIQAIEMAAAAHGIPCLVDDEALSIGAGSGSKTWPLTNLPAIDQIDFSQLHDIPTVLVTGSNGKTTTTRLLAAMLKASGKRVGYCSTEGVIINGESAQTGDLSGPAGARAVLRDNRIDAAVLETARGGILRRGLSMRHAHCAVVSNITADHFGEYGVDNLADLAEVKLTVASVLSGLSSDHAQKASDYINTTATEGTLVLNADDAQLSERVSALLSAQRCKVALFAFDNKHMQLQSLRKKGASTCGVADGKLLLHHQGITTVLGSTQAMPLTINGAAQYNIANIAAASLAAAIVGVAPNHIAQVACHFGELRSDNPGRLSRWNINGATVLLDYAHNPDGLAALLDVALTLSHKANARIPGRLGLLLGQAGNRDNDALNELAIVAAHAEPNLIIIKELPKLLRGRALGEVPLRLQADLIEAGVPATNIVQESDEIIAAKRLVNWATAGDVIVLPVHTLAARAEVVTWLDGLNA
jgi:cyanophycin synthetase